MNKKLVIGIAGGSGSGKSSLAEEIKFAFDNDVLTMHLDDYFIPKEAMPLLADESNYDDPKSVDYQRLLKDLRYLLTEPEYPRLIIIEGFLLFHFDEIRELLNLKIFLKAPFAIIAKRRVHPMWDNYLTNVLQPMYQRYVLPSSRYADVIFDVSAEPPEVVSKKTIEKISGMLKKMEIQS